MQRTARLAKELPQLSTNPPVGISCWPKDESRLDILEANITGPENTPYANGIFKLELEIPDRYPFEPPKVRFVTPVYHPNIDNGGRICLDLLKPLPKGSWKPMHNIAAVLTSIQQLLGEANPDDALMAEIANEYKFNRQMFNKRAQECTKLHAIQS